MLVSLFLLTLIDQILSQWSEILSISALHYLVSPTVTRNSVFSLGSSRSALGTEVPITSTQQVKEKKRLILSHL